MDSPTRSRSRGKRDYDNISEVKSDRGGDGDFDGSDKRKHRSNKPRRPSSGGEADGLDGSGRSSGDKNETRKRPSNTSQVGSDEDVNDKKRERSKQMKKSKEESSLEKLSSWYQDGELENKQDDRDKSGNRGHSRADDSERRKTSTKVSDHDSSHSRSRSKEEIFRTGDYEKVRDSRSLDRSESSREKDHGSSEMTRNPRKRWDESDTAKKIEDSSYKRAEPKLGKLSDSKRQSARERSLSAKIEIKESTRKSYEDTEMDNKSSNREESIVDIEGVEDDDNKESLKYLDYRSSMEKNENHRQRRTPTGIDSADSLDMSLTIEEDGRTGVREKSMRESDRSTSSERSGKRYPEAEYSEVEYERSSNTKRKDLEKDVYRDDRSKGRDDRERKDGDASFDHSREWDYQRLHGRERTGNERLHGRSGGRKDGNRGEAVKTSSKFGISNENYDVIEIQTKPLDYRRTEVGQASEKISAINDEDREKTRGSDIHGSGDDLKDRYINVASSVQDQNIQNTLRDENEIEGGKGRGQKVVMVSGGSQPPYGNQEQGSFNRIAAQGVKGNRLGRGGRGGRPIGRDNQQVNIPLPMMGSPFGTLGMPPPGPMQALTPTMSPCPPMSPGVFIPPFSQPVVWPGALAVPPGLSPAPPGPSGPRFPSNMGTPPNPGIYFNQPGPGRGGPLNISGPGFNPVGPAGRGQPHEKPSGGWVPPRTGPLGKAPSRGEQNDYSQNFVDTGMRPQNFIRELELTNVVEDYPKLRELIQKKDEIVANSSSPPMYFQCDLREHVLSPEFFNTKFDVILVDPPWEEYVHRAPGVADHMDHWTFEEILNLKIEAIADTPSFIFLWVGDGVGLEQGRQCLKKWGFRRCEDICWVKTNKTNATPGLRHDSHTLFQHSKEHCLMGIKGTVRRSTDGHIIHANIDTDVIIAEEPPYGSTAKPEDMYRIIEHFSLGRRRLELFGGDHNIRSGWLTVGKELSSSNFNAEAYVRNFADKDGKVWQGGGGRNPPPDAPHLVVTTPDIESLRPKSPMKNQQQMQQQQSTSVISLTTATSSNKRSMTTGNSPHNSNPMLNSMNQEGSSSNAPTPGTWAPQMALDEKVFDIYGYSNNNISGIIPVSGDYAVDFDVHRTNNMF